MTQRGKYNTNSKICQREDAGGTRRRRRITKKGSSGVVMNAAIPLFDALRKRIRSANSALRACPLGMTLRGRLGLCRSSRGGRDKFRSDPQLAQAEACATCGPELRRYTKQRSCARLKPGATCGVMGSGWVYVGAPDEGG